MIYWNTVSELLKECLLKLMQAPELADFRLVGGTALSLQVGHRMSVDIDLFTDKLYGSVDFNTIETYLLKTFPFVQGDIGSDAGMGKSYLIGESIDNFVKLDIYYSQDSFFQPFVLQDEVRLASVEEIIAMKVDIIQRTGRKKDFWDLHELLELYDIVSMIELHSQRFEWTHDEALIRQNFILFDEADLEPDPICLRDKTWIFIKEDFENSMD